MSTYKCISNFGKGAADVPVNDPVTYCLAQTVDNEFMHGTIGQTISGTYSKNCQVFMSDKCAANWDGICEYSSNNRSFHPNNIQKNCSYNNLTSGEILIQNTATRKYLVENLGSCSIKYESFDPTVASSPIIGSLQGDCIPVYAVDPKTIDSDIVMNKILHKPIIAIDLLVNIYNTAKLKETFNNLHGTKIYNFFMSHPFQKYIRKINN